MKPTIMKATGKSRGRGSGGWFLEKRYPTSQRTIVLQFPSREEAEAWDRAGQPLTLSLHATAENEQHEGDDRQDDQDGPQHGEVVPDERRSQPIVHVVS